MLRTFTVITVLTFCLSTWLYARGSIHTETRTFFHIFVLTFLNLKQLNYSRLHVLKYYNFSLYTLLTFLLVAELKVMACANDKMFLSPKIATPVSKLLEICQLLADGVRLVWRTNSTLNTGSIHMETRTFFHIFTFLFSHFFQLTTVSRKKCEIIKFRAIQFQKITIFQFYTLLTFLLAAELEGIACANDWKFLSVRKVKFKS